MSSDNHHRHLPAQPVTSAAPPALAGMTVKLTILQGYDLIAKDRNALGLRSKSDPYVQVYGPHDNNFIGKTDICYKTVNPEWNQTFTIELSHEDANKLVQQNGGLCFILKILDHDLCTDDDPMGEVRLPLRPWDNAADDYGSALWYSVTTGHGADFCHNAKGQLQLQLSMQGKPLQDICQGQSRLLAPQEVTNLQLSTQWRVIEQREGRGEPHHHRHRQRQRMDLDSSCVAINRDGQIDMEETVYYGNLTNMSQSIHHSGDEKTVFLGKHNDDDKNNGIVVGNCEELISMDLSKIPRHVLALYFLLSVATPDKTLEDVESATVTLANADTGLGICRCVAHLSEANTSLLLFRLERCGKNTNRNSAIWKLTPMEAGDTHARDFGSLIPEIKNLTRDLLPDLRVDPHERVAVMRKGATMRVQDYVQDLPEWITFGLGWDAGSVPTARGAAASAGELSESTASAEAVDLDASAILLDNDFQLVDIVGAKTGRMVSKDRSIHHSGDDTRGDRPGDDERISVSLPNVQPNIHYVGFVINSYSGQELDDVQKAFCHLYDTETSQDIATFTLSRNRALDKHTALFMACLYRSTADDGATSCWTLRTLAETVQGKSARDNVSDFQRLVSKMTHLPSGASRRHTPPLEYNDTLQMPMVFEEILEPAAPSSVVVDQTEFVACHPGSSSPLRSTQTSRRHSHSGHNVRPGGRRRSLKGPSRNKVKPFVVPVVGQDGRVRMGLSKAYDDDMYHPMYTLPPKEHP